MLVREQCQNIKCCISLHKSPSLDEEVYGKGAMRELKFANGINIFMNAM
jgi:hypothetical protein